MRKNENGFGIVEILLIVVAIVIVGLLGWRFFGASNDIKTEQSVQMDKEAPAVTKAADLDTADAALESTDVEGSASEQLYTETNF